jgi:hypothetical protein
VGANAGLLRRRAGQGRYFGIRQLLIIAKAKNISVLPAELFDYVRDLLECLLMNLRFQGVLTGSLGSGRLILFLKEPSLAGGPNSAPSKAILDFTPGDSIYPGPESSDFPQ